MLEKYEFLSTEWLLFGKGLMYKEGRLQNLFDYEIADTIVNDRMQNKNMQIRNEIDFKDVIDDKPLTSSAQSDFKAISDVVKIVWFYQNNSFEEFFPKK
jgi:hypothetical protein